MNIKGKLELLSELNQKSETLARIKEIESRGEKTDINEIPVLYEKFNVIKNPNNKYNTDIFISVIYFMYCPECLIMKRARNGKVRRKIANILKTFPSDISMRLSKGRFLLKKSKSFYIEAQRVYDALNQDKQETLN